MGESDELDGMRAKIAFLEDNNRHLTENIDLVIAARDSWRQVALGYANILRLEGS